MKKTSKKLLALIIAAVMAITAIPFSGIDFGSVFTADAAVEKTNKHFQSGDYVYKFRTSTGNELEIVKYLGSDKNVIVPEKIDGYTVKSIGAEAFTDRAENSTTAENKQYWTNINLKNIESVVLPETITNIGQSAFENCSKLKSTNLPESLNSISTRAFKGTGITELNLPEGFYWLGANALEGLKITELILPESMIDIGQNALYCETLEKIVFKGHIQSFSSKAFTSYYGEKVNGKTEYESCSPDEIIFHKSISGTAPLNFPSGYDIVKDKETGYWNAVRYEETYYKDALNESKVYKNAYFKYIITPENEAVIVEFTSLSTTAAAIDQNVTPQGYGKIPIVEIMPRAFTKCTKLQRLILPDTIRRIGFSAFEGCKKLYSINIPQGVECIESSTFKNCEALGNITIPDSVKEICGSAFEGAVLFYPVDFDGSNVESIGARAFYNIGFSAFYPEFNETTFIFNENLKEIAPYAFYRSTLTYIELPEGIEKIGDYAFYSYNCRFLKSVSFPNTLKSIGDYAFQYTKLTELDLPESLEHIGIEAFANTNLTAVEIPPLMTTLSTGVFRNSQISNIHIPSNIKEIHSGAFAYCPITHITIDEGVEKIYHLAFEFAEVEELTIPSTVKTIYCTALGHIKIGTLNYNAANAAIENVGQNESLLGWCLNVDTVNFGESVRHIGSYFAADSDIKSLNLTDSIESIGESAFKNCKCLTSINLPSNLKAIGDYTFASCISLKKLDLPDGLETIGNHAFDCCKALESIEFPDSVETIGNYAFTDCTALTQITLPKNAKSIGTYAFKNCTGLTEITIPENVQSLSQAAFDGCTAVKEINLYAVSCSIIPTEEPDADNIPVSPFSTLESLEDVHIYGTVKELPPYLFSKMQGIDTIELPASVTDIGTGAFANSSITSVNALGNIESIEEYAFKNCVNLTEAPLEDGIMLIGMEAFSGCKSLRSVYIPDSIFNIEIMAFAECENLESVRMSPNVDYIPRKAFYNCVSLNSFEWNSESKLVGRLAFGNCVKLSTFDFVNLEKLYINSFTGSGVTVVQLGESLNEANPALLTTVEIQSFKNCESLETVGIGGNISTVKSQAFAECSNLETAVIADSVTEIADDAFDGCDNLTIYCSETSYAYLYAQEQGIRVSTFVIDAIPNQTYTGFEIKPVVSVSLSGSSLDENVDFGVSYANNINVGTADVTVKGKGDFKMFASRANFTIVTRNIANAEIAPISEQNYTGSAVTPLITITDGGKVLREGVDYSIKLSNNIEEGTAKISIKGEGNYSGSTSAEFTIKKLTQTQSFLSRIFTLVNSIFARIKSFITGIFR